MSTEPAERAVPLPSGGIAYVTTRATHEQATALRRHSLKIARFIGPVRDADGKSGEGFRTDLTDEQQDAKDELILESPVVHIRTLTTRWEGVTGKDGEALTFPDNVTRMQETDFAALFDALTTRSDAEGKEARPSGSG